MVGVGGLPLRRRACDDGGVGHVDEEHVDGRLRRANLRGGGGDTAARRTPGGTSGYDSELSRVLDVGLRCLFLETLYVI